jgi:hypothetical protein
MREKCLILFRLVNVRVSLQIEYMVSEYTDVSQKVESSVEPV